MAAPGNKVYTVRELTQEIRALLTHRFPRLWVVGEVSSLRRSHRGHAYFNLIEGEAVLRCVLFASDLRKQRVALQNGIQVQVFGELDVYGRDGTYQLIVRLVVPAGLGEEWQRVEALKRKLAAEGLFREERKRPIPSEIRVVGVVTSPRGAAIQDILRILGQEGGFEVVLSPTRVQGEGAEQEIAEALWALAQIPDVDVIILARGGGSKEDLSAFNREVVVRAVAAMPVPVISAVGHEVDLTLSDLAADLRVPTPTAAAQVVVRTRQDLRQRLEAARKALRHHIEQLLALWRYRLAVLSRSRYLQDPMTLVYERERVLDDLASRLRRAQETRWRERQEALLRLRLRLVARSPEGILQVGQERLKGLSQRLRRGVQRRLEEARHRLAERSGRLEGLDPHAVLRRGYAFVSRKAGGRPVTSPAQAPPGTPLWVRLREGALWAEVRREANGGEGKQDEL